MTDIRIGPSFQSLDDFYKQYSTIKFPGYGAGPGPRAQIVGRVFQVRKLEIPRSGKARYFVVEKLDDGRVHLVDDFVERDNDPSAFAHGFIVSMGLVGDKLIYMDRQSKVVREAPVR